MEEQRYKLKKLVEELSRLRGRHTELVTVYVPAGANLIDTVNQLRNEQGTAENIKSKGTRKNVVGALEKILQHLKLYPNTPSNGLAVFCGNVSEHEGADDIRLWAVEPPDKLEVKRYWCDQKFVTEPLEDMVKEKEVFGLLVMDTKEATIGVLKGKKIVVLRRMDSIVPGKQSHGGQCMTLDTLVQLSDGNIVKLGEVKEGISVKSADFPNLNIRDSVVLDVFFNTDKTKIYKISTKNPRREIETSKDHFFFVLEGDEIVEKAAEELKIGDILLLPEKMNISGSLQNLNTFYHRLFYISDDGRKLLINKRLELGLSQEEVAKKLNTWQATISGIELGARTHLKNSLLRKLCEFYGLDFDEFRKNHILSRDGIRLPRNLNEELAQIAGYFLGDGNYDVNRIAFSEFNILLARFYMRFIERLFGCKVVMDYRSAKHCYNVRINSKVIHDFFRGELFPRKDSKSSLIPPAVLKSDDSVLAGLIRGFFDADGYVSKGRAAFGINNKLLAQQMQLALLRFGILSSLLVYDNRRNPYSKNYRYSLIISDTESLGIFANKIGFSEHAKNSTVIKKAEERAGKNWCRSVLINRRTLRKMFGARAVIGVSQGLISKKAFGRFLEKISGEEKERTKRLLSAPIIPSRIKSINISENNVPMADIAVKYESFIANGIFVHNSAARFARVREGLVNDFYKIIAENMKALIPPEAKGIIIGGPGPSKKAFHDNEYLPTDLQKKILVVKDIGYTDEYGLEELVQRSQDVLSEAAVAQEKALLQKFFVELQKGSGLVVYKIEDIQRALENSAVDMLIVSENAKVMRCPSNHFTSDQKCHICQLKTEEVDATDAFKDIAHQYGTKVEIISRDTREGQQLFNIGGLGAILRWRIG